MINLDMHVMIEWHANND